MKRRDFLKTVSTAAVFGVVSSSEAVTKSINIENYPLHKPLKEHLLGLTELPSFDQLLTDIQKLANNWRFGEHHSHVVPYKAPQRLSCLWEKFTTGICGVVCRSLHGILKEHYNMSVDIRQPNSPYSRAGQYASVSCQDLLEYGLYDSIGWEHIVNRICICHDHVLEQINSNWGWQFGQVVAGKIEIHMVSGLILRQPIKMEYWCNNRDTRFHIVADYDVVVKGK